MNKLEQQFVNRFKNYKENTAKIFESIPNAIEAVKITLADQDYESLVWEDIQYVADQRIIIIIGNVKLVIGDNIKLDDGRIVTVDEENVVGLRRLVRVNLPVDVVFKGTVDEIVEYLAEKRVDNFKTIDKTNEGVEGELNIYDQDYTNEIGLTDEQAERMRLTPVSKKVH